jgi:hypothetical protein
MSKGATSTSTQNGIVTLRGDVGSYSERRQRYRWCGRPTDSRKCTTTAHNRTPEPRGL